jgi:hypothetical protein
VYHNQSLFQEEIREKTKQKESNHGVYFAVVKELLNICPSFCKGLMASAFSELVGWLIKLSTMDSWYSIVVL